MVVMNKDSYLFSIGLGCVCVIAGLFESIELMRFGGYVYTMESFNAWYLCTTMISLAWVAVLLRYYLHKNYSAAFWTATVYGVAILLQGIVTFAIRSGNSNWIALYAPMTILFLVVMMAAAAGMIFSNAGTRRWLKFGGIFLGIIGIFILGGFAWSLLSSASQEQKSIVLLKLSQFSSLSGSLWPLFPILNFYSELKELDLSKPNSRSAFDLSLIALSTILITATIATGASVASEAGGHKQWNDHLSDDATKWNSLYKNQLHINAKGDTLSFKLIQPEEYDSTKRYPLVVCLPFGGSIEGCPPAQYLLEKANRKKYPAFLFVPYCPDGKGWGGVPNYPAIDTLVFETINDLKDQFQTIDSKRIYVTGVSRGGYGSWHFISTNPDMFAAAIPVCGGGDPKFDNRIRDVDVWAFHGTNDVNVPVQQSRDMIDAIKKAGGDPKYTEFKNSAHYIWPLVIATPDLLDWLFEQKK